MPKRIGEFEIKSTIGEGTFGLVKEAIHLHTGQRVAIKILEKRKIQQQDDLKRIFREMSILKKLRHPNVIMLYELLETDKSLYIVTEYMRGGQLYDMIKNHGRLTESQARIYFKQILQGIDYIHGLGVAHRDLKPENILIEQDEIKIIDFGLSRQFKEGQFLTTSCGSPCYAAPQMIAGDKYEPMPADIWSLGIILYAMVCGYLPFEDNNTKKLYKKITKGVFEMPSDVSTDCQDILRQIINVNAERRPTASNLLKHPWCKGISTLNAYQTHTLDESVLSMLAKMTCQTKQDLREYLENNMHTPLNTYYLLLQRKMTKMRHRPASNSEMTRMRIGSQIHRRETFQIPMHVGPIHTSYVFHGPLQEARNAITKKFEGYRVKFKGASVKIQDFEVKLKCLVPEQLFYLDAPFYFPIQV